METIKYTDLDFSRMQVLSHQGANSKVYTDGTRCFKMFNSRFISGRKELLQKINAMDGIKIDGVLFPKETIMKDNIFAGYSMDFVPNTTCLYDHFCCERYVDANDILQATKRASQMLEQLHKKGILLCDLSFDNILISENDGSISICDIDGCRYKNFSSDYISILSKIFYEERCKRPIIDENFDRQAMLLAMIATLFDKVVFEMDDYDTLADHIKTLEEMRFIIDNVFNDTRAPIPYLHEMIQDDDHYIIDRATQVSPERRRAKDYTMH